MSDPPKARDVVCPNCDAEAVALIPADSELVEQEDDFDGKVWTTCRSCEERFLVYYQADV